MNSEKTILLVEDDKIAFQTIYESLEFFKFKCHGVSTLAEALEIIKKIPFDLILADYMLPDGTCLDLLVEVRKFRFDLPFVVVTATEDNGIIREAMRKGASDFLKKPFNLKNLPAIIERNLERRRIEQKKNSPQKATVLLKTIKALITALEAKDRYTSGHSLRVARHARLMAIALNLSEEEQFILELSAILHDIGKIGMPDRILNKASHLHELEYRIAKEHPVIGSNIVGKIDELIEVAAIIRHHHERYDGTGYPDGLQGKVIPKLARVLAIVDAYESIISNRVYSKPKTPEDALQEIAKSAGSQFDPELVKVFVSVMHSELATQKMRLRIEDFTDISE
ncbi:MAG: HD domain-containing protein [Calditrichaeota bacterium]|nr:HD domain-containing protein [Calditrichota bacterium]